MCFLIPHQKKELRAQESVQVFVDLDQHQDGVQVCVEGRDGNVLMNRWYRNDIARSYFKP